MMTRFASLAAVLVLFATSAWGQNIIEFTDFSDVSSLNLNGSATTANNGSQDVLRLTNSTSQGGSAFLNLRLPISAGGGSFSSEFSFQIGPPDSGGAGADGLTFTVQSGSSGALGGFGIGIGYSGVSDSVTVEFDTHDNGGPPPDINGNHVGINLNGDIASIASVDPGPTLEDGTVYYAWVDYDGIVLEVRLATVNTRPASPLVAAPVDLFGQLGVEEAYFGFTAGTGGLANNHDILNWRLVTGIVEPIPTLHPLALLGLMALVLLGGLGMQRGRNGDRS